jgi:hypothetical protein
VGDPNGDLNCREILDSTKHMLFTVSNSLVFPTDKNLSIGVTFWDAGTDNISLEYQAVGNPLKLVSITKTNTKTWKTTWFSITDANFVPPANTTQFNFRIGNGNQINSKDNSVEYISEVTVINQSR